MASEAENTFANSKKIATPPSNSQDSPSDDSEDRDDTVNDTDSSDVSRDLSGNNNNFTFMGNEGGAALKEISKMSSVEQYRDFLEKELGEEKLMRAYPLLKEFGDKILFFEKTAELECILSGVLTTNEIRKYQPHFATWIFMELQAEAPDGEGGKIGISNAMKTLKNINMTTASFMSFL